MTGLLLFPPGYDDLHCCDALIRGFLPDRGPLGLAHRHPVHRALHELVHHGRVEAVAELVRDDAPDDRHADKRKVAEDVEDFVPHELVVVPEPFLVQHPVRSEDHRVLQGTAPGEAVRLEHLDVAQETEGARGGDIADEVFLGEMVIEALLLEQGVVEADTAGVARPFGRPDSIT